MTVCLRMMIQALAWMRKAADQGEGDAQFFLGFRYSRGVRVPKDVVEGVNWYRKAA